MSVLSALSKRKTLLIIIALVVVALLVGGFFALRMMQERQAIAMGLAAEPVAAETPQQAAPAARRPAGQLPMYAPLDVFTANLADRDRDRFGQVGVTFEIADKEAEAMMKSYTPIFRSRILIMLSSKTAADLLTVEGKKAFSDEILAMARTEVGRQNATKIYGVLFSNFVIQ